MLVLLEVCTTPWRWIYQDSREIWNNFMDTGCLTVSKFWCPRMLLNSNNLTMLTHSNLSQSITCYTAFIVDGYYFVAMLFCSPCLPLFCSKYIQSVSNFWPNPPCFTVCKRLVCRCCPAQKSLFHGIHGTMLGIKRTSHWSSYRCKKSLALFQRFRRKF